MKGLPSQHGYRGESRRRVFKPRRVSDCEHVLEAAAGRLQFVLGCSLYLEKNLVLHCSGAGTDSEEVPRVTEAGEPDPTGQEGLQMVGPHGSHSCASKSHLLYVWQVSVPSGFLCV